MNRSLGQGQALDEDVHVVQFAMRIGIGRDVAFFLDAVGGAKFLDAVVAQDLTNLIVAPDIECAFGFPGRIFLRQAVGILGGEERAERAGEIVLDVLEDVAGDFRENLVARHLVRTEIDLRELGLIVEHFLKVGHMPLGIDGVTMEAAAEVIVNSARRHLAQGIQDHAPRGVHILLRKVFPAGDVEKEFEIHGPGKFRRASETAFARVKHPGVLGKAQGHGFIDIPFVGTGSDHFGFGLAQGGEKRLGFFLDLLAISLP